ncbi:adhesin, partial [Xanthomonas oryzae pv. oryzae]
MLTLLFLASRLATAHTATPAPEATSPTSQASTADTTAQDNATTPPDAADDIGKHLQIVGGSDPAEDVGAFAAEPYGVAIGEASNALGEGGIALGAGATVTAKHAIATGYAAAASGESAVAIGGTTEIFDYNDAGEIIGSHQDSTEASQFGAVALGGGAKATAALATAVG